ncbi:MAG: hypothetical protein AB7V50_08365 [Vampirovibrionia bacterium]
MKRGYQGQEAIEFILITILVFFGALFSITVFSGKLADFFSDKSAVNSTSKVTTKLINPQEQTKFSQDFVKSVDLSDENNVIETQNALINSDFVCDGTDCTFTVGEFSFENVPSNFNDYIASTGSSGGTSVVSDLLNQYASQLAAQDIPQESVDKVRQLANLGHLIANFEKSIEVQIKSCDGADKCEATAASQLDRGIVNVGEAMKSYLNNPFEFGANKDSKVAYQFIDTLNQIKDDSNIPQNSINVIQELAWDIGVMGEDFQNNLNQLMNIPYNGFYDPLTGVDVYNTVNDDPTDYFLNYSASKITNFNSALICANSKSEDSGSECH